MKQRTRELGRWVRELKREHQLPRWALLAIATAPQGIRGRHRRLSAPQGKDVRLMSAVLAVSLGLSLLLRRRSTGSAWMHRGALYLAVATAVYFDRSATTWLDLHGPWQVSLFVVLVIAVLVRFRLASDRRFRITPLDVLVIFIAIVIPNLPGSIATTAILGESVAKLVALMYGAETLLAASPGMEPAFRARPQWSCLRSVRLVGSHEPRLCHTIVKVHHIRSSANVAPPEAAHSLSARHGGAPTTSIGCSMKKQWALCAAVARSSRRFWPPAPAPEERKVRYLEKGEKHFAERNYEKARVEFRNALQIDPQGRAQSDTTLDASLRGWNDPREAAAQYPCGGGRRSQADAAGALRSADSCLLGGLPDKAMELAEPGFGARSLQNAQLLTVPRRGQGATRGRATARSRTRKLP